MTTASAHLLAISDTTKKEASRITTTPSLPFIEPLVISEPLCITARNALSVHFLGRGGEGRGWLTFFNIPDGENKKEEREEGPRLYRIGEEA